MKIKIGTVKKDPTAYGNKYSIVIEDTSTCDNKDLDSLVGKQVAVVIDTVDAIDNLISQTEVV